MGHLGNVYFRLRLHRLRLPRWLRPRINYGALGFGAVCVLMLAEVQVR